MSAIRVGARATFIAITCAYAGCGAGPEGPDARKTDVSALELRSVETPSEPPLAQSRARELADRAAAKALDDLRGLQGRVSSDRLAQLPRERAEKARAYFADRRAEPDRLSLRYTHFGTPASLEGPGFRIPASALGLPPDAPARHIADAFVERFASLWKVERAAFDQALVRETRRDSGASRGLVTVSYRQLHAGLVVLGGAIEVLVNEPDAEIVAVLGHFVPVDDVPTRATITAEAARSAAGGSETEPRLALWTDGEAVRLVWVADQLSDEHGVERVLVDATTGDVRQRQSQSQEALRRQHWDLRDRADLYVATCQKWGLSYPPAGCGASCTPCTTDPKRCDSCACVAPGDPADCVSAIWRYDETTGCVPDGIPAGEGACDADALTCFSASQSIYDYWFTSFGRRSWDGVDGPMWTKSRWRVDDVGGMATRWDRDMDGVPELAWVSIRTGSANPWLLGHELGHSLQQGAVLDDGTDESLYGTWGASFESHADTHGYRYQDLDLPITSCTGFDLTHYTELRTAPGTFFAQVNKHIGNCQAWLMTQEAFGSWWHKGATTVPTTPEQFDQIWYRALDGYSQHGDSYFTWWDHLTSAAFDLYDWSPPLFAAGNSTDAVGNWTQAQSLSGKPRPGERIAALSWDGASAGPCAFYRPSWDATRIMYECRNANGIWYQPSPFNNPSIDPAASEPTAAYRYEGGKIYGYVLWRGTDNRIRYRRFDMDTFSVGPPGDFGPGHLTAGPVAAAGTWETPFVDRLMVVYHPLAQPTWLFATHLGSPTPATDLGGSFDTDAPPSMAAYPYPGRVYVVRPDFSSGRHLAYRSYSVSGGWTVKQDITNLYLGDEGIDANVVRTDRGVALTEYGRSDPQLRMAYITLPGTGGTRELWYATLSESSPGVLARGRYRAVPLAAVTTFTSSHAGGLAEDRWGWPLWHFWAQGPIAGSPDLHHMRTHSD